MDCSHLLDNVILSNASCGENVAITKNFCCSECGVKEQVWLCLHCGVINCGRYMKGHAKLHSESSQHQLCMSCDVFSVYCYKCDDYVSNDLENGAIDKIRKKIMYSCNTTNLNEDFDNGNSVDDSEHETFSIFNNSVEEVRSSFKSNIDELHIVNDTSNSSSSDISLKTTNKSLENNEHSKNAWPVEARNLRPRTIKRSHSESSSSTENNAHQTRNNKLVKVSLCNGKVQRDKRVVGLKNLGNTCFMNAVLQSLNNIQEFSCYFNQLPCLETKPNGRRVYHSRSYTRQDVNDVVMAEELRKVLINLNNGCGSKGAISPECLFLVIWKVVPRFRGYQQQDAHEFLRYMLDRLHTELLHLVPHDRSEVGFVPKTPSASIVTAVFGGTLQSEVKCLACGTQSNKYDPFLDLSLELPETGRHEAPVSLNDCLASFVQVEELADTERYFCSSCKCKQKSTKQFWIRRLPNVLCLHLKRFRWHNYFRTKVATAIEFPLEALDMSEYVLSGGVDTRRAGLGSRYDLACVVVHHGSGAGSGHYTAFAINDGQWYHFNDQSVRVSNEKSVASCKPYILFYIRREIS